MRRLALFLSVVVALLGAAAVFDWWVDPFGDIYKPAALTDALESQPNCLISQELVGARYFAFKLDVFHRRPTTRFVVGSSRVLKIQSHSGERAFANLGFPGSSPETILAQFRALPARPRDNWHSPQSSQTTTLPGSSSTACSASFNAAANWR